jgi:OOP family OmpA-OmpF porin
MRALSLAAALFLAPALAVAQTPPTFQMENGALKLPAPITFVTGGDKVNPDSAAALDHVAAYLKAKDYITLLRIEVHTDTDGSAEANQKLSEQRAMAIARELIGRGVTCDRLIPVGFGGTKPVAPNDTPENKALNRRAVFANAALKGRPIGGMPVDGGGKVAGDPCK